VLDQAKQTVGTVTNQARDQVKTQLEGQKDRATETLGTVAEAIRASSEHLRSHEAAPISEYAERIAATVDGFAGSLRNKTVDDMFRDVEGFARRQPALFLGAAFAVGFIAARFLKSSSPPEPWNGGGSAAGTVYPQASSAYGTAYRGSAAPAATQDVGMPTYEQVPSTTAGMGQTETPAASVSSVAAADTTPVPAVSAATSDYGKVTGTPPGYASSTSAKAGVPPGTQDRTSETDTLEEGEVAASGSYRGSTGSEAPS